MDLQDANCIISPNSTNQLWSFQENGKQLNVSVSGNLEFNQVAPLLKLVRPDWVSACSCPIKSAFLQKNRLIVLLEKFELPPRPINVVYPHVRFLPTRTRLFIQWMKEELKGLKTESVGIS